MIIKTITSHDVYNYGASLQAYALMTYLQSEGHNVEIIGYYPEYENRRYELNYIHPASKLYTLSQRVPCLKRICQIVFNRKDFLFWNRKRAFDAFTRDKLCVTRKHFHNNEELKLEKFEADLFIAGSDQIWNTEHGKGKDPAFYLDFVGDSSKCISYAASFATSKIAEGYLEFVKMQLSNLRAISVRETSGVTLANSIGYTAKQVMDPSFLLSKKSWTELIGETEKKLESRLSSPYILLYDFSENYPELDAFARKLSKETGLRLLSINDWIIRSYVDKNINNAGPLEFLCYIKNASHVISNSFHATVFSLLFNTDFFTFPLKGQNSSSRMKDLLNLVGLPNRFLENDIVEVNTINWKDVNSIIETESISSREWLLHNLKNI